MSTETKEIALDTNGLPCITKVLPTTDVPWTTFVMPNTKPHTSIATGDESHQPKIGVRLLVIEKGQATPFHKNPDKDKAYLVTSGFIRVYVLVNGEIVEYNWSFRDNALLIPAGTPHAVVGTGEGGNQVTVCYAPDVNDVVWQKDAGKMNGKTGQALVGID